MRSARSPNTSRSPAAARASGEPCPAPGAAAAGRARVPRPTSRPEAANVTASMASAARTPRNVVATPPTPAPATSAARKVVWITAVPRAYRSPARMSGVMEARADSNGGANIVAANSSATRAASSAHAARSSPPPGPRGTISQQTITVRRGRRSASSARNKPPITHGRYPAAYAAAASSGERVRS